MLLLYGLQCLRWLPGASGAWLGRGSRLRHHPGPGWCLLHPLPSAVSLLTTRLPIAETEAGMVSRSAPGRFAPALPGASPAPVVGWQQLSDAEAAGSLVRLAGRPFARAASASQADELARRLREIGRAEAAGPAGDRLEVWLAEGTSLSDFREAWQRTWEATRWLARACDLCFVWLFVGLPALVLLFHSERGLLLGLPPWVAIHGVALVLLARTWRRLLPAAGGERFEALLAAALYPPLLLRAPSELCSRALAGFHPATVAAALLEGESRRAFLRSELARCVYEPTDGSGPLELARREHAAVVALIRESGESPEALLAPPPHLDGLAAGYCPLCLSDYRSAGVTCSDCGIPVHPYPSPA